MPGKIQSLPGFLPRLSISAMEGKGTATLGSGLDTIKAVMNALEAAGIELLDNGPGVRLKPVNIIRKRNAAAGAEA